MRIRKMKKVSKVIIGLLVIGVVIAALVYTGIINIQLPAQIGANNENEDTGIPCTTCGDEYDTEDIFFMLQALSGRNLNYLEGQAYIGALHMKAYGVNEKTHNTVINEYVGYYADLTYIGQQTLTSTGWSAILASWLDGTQIKAVIAGSGASVTAVYGYDVMVLTMYGPTSTAQAFVEWITEV